MATTTGPQRPPSNAFELRGSLLPAVSVADANLVAATDNATKFDVEAFPGANAGLQLLAATEVTALDGAKAISTALYEQVKSGLFSIGKNKVELAGLLKTLITSPFFATSGLSGPLVNIFLDLVKAIMECATPGERAAYFSPFAEPIAMKNVPPDAIFALPQAARAAIWNAAPIRLSSDLSHALQLVERELSIIQRPHCLTTRLVTHAAGLPEWWSGSQQGQQPQQQQPGQPAKAPGKTRFRIASQLISFVKGDDSRYSVLTRLITDRFIRTRDPKWAQLRHDCYVGHLSSGGGSDSTALPRDSCGALIIACEQFVAGDKSASNRILKTLRTMLAMAFVGGTSGGGGVGSTSSGGGGGDTRGGGQIPLYEARRLMVLALRETCDYASARSTTAKVFTMEVKETFDGDTKGVAYLDYCKRIAPNKPMDFGTMKKQRVGKYQSFDELLDDARRVVENCRKYHGQNAALTIEAQALYEHCESICERYQQAIAAGKWRELLESEGGKKGLTGLKSLGPMGDETLSSSSSSGTGTGSSSVVNTNSSHSLGAAPAKDIFCVLADPHLLRACVQVIIRDALIPATLAGVPVFEDFSSALAALSASSSSSSSISPSNAEVSGGATPMVAALSLGSSTAGGRPLSSASSSSSASSFPLSDAALNSLFILGLIDCCFLKLKEETSSSSSAMATTAASAPGKASAAKVLTKGGAGAASGGGTASATTSAGGGLSSKYRISHELQYRHIQEVLGPMPPPAANANANANANVNAAPQVLASAVPPHLVLACRCLQNTLIELRLYQLFPPRPPKGAAAMRMAASSSNGSAGEGDDDAADDDEEDLNGMEMDGDGGTKATRGRAKHSKDNKGGDRDRGSDGGAALATAGEDAVGSGSGSGGGATTLAQALAEAQKTPWNLSLQAFDKFKAMVVAVVSSQQPQDQQQEGQQGALVSSSSSSSPSSSSSAFGYQAFIEHAVETLASGAFNPTFPSSSSSGSGGGAGDAFFDSFFAPSASSSSSSSTGSGSSSSGSLAVGPSALCTLYRVLRRGNKTPHSRSISALATCFAGFFFKAPANYRELIYLLALCGVASGSGSGANSNNSNSGGGEEDPTVAECELFLPATLLPNLMAALSVAAASSSNAAASTTSIGGGAGPASSPSGLDGLHVAVPSSDTTTNNTQQHPALTTLPVSDLSTLFVEKLLLPWTLASSYRGSDSTRPCTHDYLTRVIQQGLLFKGFIARPEQAASYIMKALSSMAGSEEASAAAAAAIRRLEEARRNAAVAGSQFLSSSSSAMLLTGGGVGGGATGAMMGGISGYFFPGPGSGSGSGPGSGPGSAASSSSSGSGGSSNTSGGAAAVSDEAGRLMMMSLGMGMGMGGAMMGMGSGSGNGMGSGIMMGSGGMGVSGAHAAAALSYSPVTPAVGGSNQNNSHANATALARSNSMASSFSAAGSASSNNTAMGAGVGAARSSRPGPLEGTMTAMAGTFAGYPQGAFSAYITEGLLTPLSVVFTRPDFATVAQNYARLMVTTLGGRNIDFRALGLSPAFLSALTRNAASTTTNTATNAAGGSSSALGGPAVPSSSTSGPLTAGGGGGGGAAAGPNTAGGTVGASLSGLTLLSSGGSLTIGGGGGGGGVGGVLTLEQQMVSQAQAQAAQTAAAGGGGAGTGAASQAQRMAFLMMQQQQQQQQQRSGMVGGGTAGTGTGAGPFTAGALTAGLGIGLGMGTAMGTAMGMGSGLMMAGSPTN